MAVYAKRTCRDCGIKLPQPEMLRTLDHPVGINGNPLSPREVWVCRLCHSDRDMRAKVANEYEQKRLAAEHKRLVDQRLADQRLQKKRHVAEQRRLEVQRIERERDEKAVLKAIARNQKQAAKRKDGPPSPDQHPAVNFPTRFKVSMTEARRKQALSCVSSPETSEKIKVEVESLRTDPPVGPAHQPRSERLSPKGLWARVADYFWRRD